MRFSIESREFQTLEIRQSIYKAYDKTQYELFLDIEEEKKFEEAWKQDQIETGQSKAGGVLV